jgi:predicted ABC-type exoprotein transport system permease subunit
MWLLDLKKYLLLGWVTGLALGVAMPLYMKLMMKVFLFIGIVLFYLWLLLDWELVLRKKQRVDMCHLNIKEYLFVGVILVVIFGVAIHLYLKK